MNVITSMIAVDLAAFKSVQLISIFTVHLTSVLDIRSIEVTRYVTPLREGGSLPAIVEGCDGFLYALKFKGSGQGIKSLIAEFIGGELARVLQLKVPELVFASLDEAFGRTEGDEEIQDLLKASRGLNLGLHYLSGAITYDAAVTQVAPLLASKIVWLDAFITNMDRTPRNTNMLMWHQELWLIDHGACLYFHHNWDSWEKQAVSAFPLISNHVLLPFASQLQEANNFALSIINEDVIHEIIDTLPESWLQEIEEVASPEMARNIYKSFLTTRLQNHSIFLKQAIDAQAALI